MKPGSATKREHDDRTLPRADGVPDESGGESPSKKRVSSKRERLQRNPSLEKVDEDLERERSESSAYGCSDYFGVRSYLHDFYDAHVYKDPVIYEDDDSRYLLNPATRRRRCCSAIWWKVFVWIGVNLLVFGVIGVLIGYLVPQRNPIVDKLRNTIVHDSYANAFNFKLNVCKLVGIGLFCIGGLTLTLALLFPSVFFRYMDDDRRYEDDEDAFKVTAGVGGVEAGNTDKPTNGSSSLLEESIPATGKIKNVQPDRKPDEAAVTREGVVPYYD